LFFGVRGIAGRRFLDGPVAPWLDVLPAVAAVNDRCLRLLRS
jgi:hypothetical protein